jgi:hypothetical protein
VRLTGQLHLHPPNDEPLRGIASARRRELGALDCLSYQSSERLAVTRPICVRTCD